ncbi:MAG: class I SAM-dependent methyltransferase [Bacillota bacterium]|nr:class I SAM-dependent methyltransferase [Bacillota bacterium]
MSDGNKAGEWSNEQIEVYLAGVAESDYPRIFWNIIKTENPAARTMIDIGSGPGAFALTAAEEGLQVQAVDTNKKKLAALIREAKRRKLERITTICGNWPTVKVNQADLAICAYSFGGSIRTRESIEAILQTALQAVYLICPFERKQTDFLSRSLYEQAGLAPPSFKGSYSDILAIFQAMGEQVSARIISYDFGMPLPAEKDLSWCARFLTDKLGLPSAKEVERHVQFIAVQKNERLWIPNPRTSVLITWKRREN